MSGIRRRHARPPDQKEAVLAEDLMRMVATLDHGLGGLRDRAILLIGFAGGLRRSEITGLDCGPEQTEEGAGWIEILDQGVLIRVRGKTGWREIEIGRGSKRCGRRGPEGATAARLMEESTKAREPSPMPLRRSPGVVTITDTLDFIYAVANERNIPIAQVIEEATEALKAKMPSQRG